MSASKHALDDAARVGSLEIRVHAELLCPCCNRCIRSFDCRETSDGVAVTCQRCHVDVFTAEDVS
jgi:hypothetical protein